MGMARVSAGFFSAAGMSSPVSMTPHSERQARITQRAIRRGTFRSVKELVTKIDQFVENDNQNARPFVWTATADSIFAKVQRLCERISGTGH